MPLWMRKMEMDKEHELEPAKIKVICRSCSIIIQKIVKLCKGGFA